MTRGQELIERWRGTHHELAGFLAGAEESGFSIVPCMATYAVPAGAIRAPNYERLMQELIEAVRKAMPLDGLLVALRSHGQRASSGRGWRIPATTSDIGGKRTTCNRYV